MLFSFTYQLALPSPPTALFPNHNEIQNGNSIAKTKNKHDLIVIPTCDSKSENSDAECFVINNHNISETNNLHNSGFCYHVGILVFAPFLSMLKKSDLGACKSYVIGWLVAVLLGAKNIEQSKLLNYKSLNLLFDTLEHNPYVQRKRLKEFATESNVNQLLSFNAELVGIDKHSDFYYDPHTKHYTGLLKILKSWCSKVRIADKVINSDFIHTTNGFPVYLNNGDTFDDMRVRFFKDIDAFRKVSKIPENKAITMCIDRGIFASEVFDKIIKMKNLHIVTWEKGYKKDMWNEKQEIKTGIIIKERNNKRDTLLISYQYQEYKWRKNDKIRQLIVKLPEKKGKGFIEVSILTDDFLRDAEQIINFILERWIQENNFKYLIAHFGIDQITSYLFNEYKDIEHTITDKQHINGEYKALTKELGKIRAKLKTVLNKKHEFDTQFGIYQDISELTHSSTKELIKELTMQPIKTSEEQSKKTPTKKQKESYKKNSREIVKLSYKYYQTKKDRNQTKKKDSKIEELKKNGIQKLATNPKQFMDTIKIIAHNIFRLGFEPFKDKYDNYRDDHVIFRTLTCSDGIIEKKNSEIYINILPTMNIPPKLKKIMSEIFYEINKKDIGLSSDSNLKIRLKMEEKIESFFAYVN